VTRFIRVHPTQFRQTDGRRIEALYLADGIGFRLIRRKRRQASLAGARFHAEQGGMLAAKIGRKRNKRGPPRRPSA